jgi:3-methyl-2-oxobutanoate hydroxymethyltransferase
MIGGDAIYCAGSLATITKLAAEGIPVVGHVGLIPARATWSGGFKAVGKTAAEAMHVYHHVKQLEAAGAVAAEIEVVPARVASEIAKRTTLVLMSMGAGSGCDAQYLFAEDVLAIARPSARHAKVYRNFQLNMIGCSAAHRRVPHSGRCREGALPQDWHLVLSSRC